MSRGDALLRAILADPDDDAPRLIYADWLDENGDGDRAEFIRVECALARADERDSRRQEMIVRRRALLFGRKEQWSGDFGVEVSHFAFRRGFVDSVVLTARQFIDDGLKLFERQPVLRVAITRLSSGVVTAKPELITELAAAEALPLVRHLVLDGQRLGDLNLRILLGAGRLDLLAGLSLRNSMIGPDGCRALSECGQLDDLTTLDLSDNPIGNPGLREMRPAFRRLRTLALSGIRLTDDGAEALARARWLRSLRRLSLGRNTITMFGARHLAQSPHLAHLEQLDLNKAVVGNEGARHLARSSYLTRLADLGLAGNGLDDAGAAAVAESANLGGLRRLDLSANALTDAGARALARSPHLGNLTALDLTHTAIGIEGRRLLRERFGPGACAFGREG